MKVELAPLIAPDRFEEQLEAEIAAWFSETVFRPLFAEFEADRPNAVDDWIPFPAKLASLGVSRERMPQIHAEDRAALVSFLEARGIASATTLRVPVLFRPTQACYSPAKIEAARAHAGSDRPILAASNDRILDGHHQWFTAFMDDPYEPIEAIVFDVPIKRLLREVDRFPGTTRENAIGDVDALMRAVNSGAISYGDGVFSGKFSAATSRAIRSLGGTFDKARKIYRVDPKSLPYTVRGSLAAARDRAESIKNGIVKRTSEIAVNVAASPTLGIKLERFTTSLLANLEEQFRESLTVAKKEIPAIDFVATPPDFTTSMVKDVREMLTHNLELSIKTFTEEEMVRVRELAEQNWTLGGRVDRLREMIEARFDVTERKARFLARQETSMVASEFSRARAQEIGSTEYVWHTRHDDRVRDDHQELNGKTFEWDDPPVVDKLRDRHANPGMDYGCRCVARPILNLQARRVA